MKTSILSLGMATVRRWFIAIYEIYFWMWLINIVFLQLPAKEGFPVIRVICHESAIYVTGHVSRESEAQGLLQIVSYLKACFPFLLVRWSFAFACLSRLQHSRSRLVASLADNWLICQLSLMHDVKPCTVWWYVCQDFSQTMHNKTNISLGFCDIRH